MTPTTPVQLLERSTTTVVCTEGAYIDIDLVLTQGPVVAAVTLTVFESGVMLLQRAVHVHGPECEG